RGSILPLLLLLLAPVLAAAQLRNTQHDHDHDHGDCAMTMYFNVNDSGFCLLFKSWRVSSGAGFMLATLFVFSLGFCRESLDVWRLGFERRHRSSGVRGDAPPPLGSDVPLTQRLLSSSEQNSSHM